MVVKTKVIYHLVHQIAICLMRIIAGHTSTMKRGIKLCKTPTVITNPNASVKKGLKTNTTLP